MEKHYFIYMLTNKYKNVLYIGVTNNLVRRVFEHKNKLHEGFTLKYNVDHLVYYEVYSDVVDAITREKQIKSWSRKKKNLLINSFNPKWEDLYSTIVG
ncbi:MAG: GIY-YIG nuclease family protein [Gammaproteobacteria bacterium]